MIKRELSDFKLTEISITPNGYEVGYQILKTNEMIKDTDLRKGNLLFLNINYKVNIQRIDEIYTDEVKVTSIEDGGCFHRMKVSSCKPIPLTPEWLERCGLERLPLGKYMIDGNWHLRIGDCIIAYDDRPSFVEGNFSYMGFRIPKQILYLHQLQNLYFALTGEELSIKETA